MLLVHLIIFIIIINVITIYNILFNNAYIQEGDVELRHQRNPDCEFDYIKPKIPGELTEQKPEFIYKVIETLLPQARYSPTNNKGTRLLEL